MNININENNRFSTQDLGLATAISLSYPLELIERTPNSNKAKFIFIKADGFDQIVEAYWRGELKSSLLGYFNQLKSIKSRLYE